MNSPYAPEYDIAGITDPFLHIRLLRLLRVLGHGDADASDLMNDILAQVTSHLNLSHAIIKKKKKVLSVMIYKLLAICFVMLFTTPISMFCEFVFYGW